MSTTRARAGTRTTPTEIESLMAEAARRGSERRAASAAAATAAFRASVEERLKALDGELAEVKSRLNGLLFLAVGAVLTQVVLRLLRW